MMSAVHTLLVLFHINCRTEGEIAIGPKRLLTKQSKASVFFVKRSAFQQCVCPSQRRELSCKRFTVARLLFETVAVIGPTVLFVSLLV